MNKNTIGFLESKGISPEEGHWIVKRDGKDISINELLDEYQKEYDTTRQMFKSIRKFWKTRIGQIIMASIFIAFGIVLAIAAKGSKQINVIAYGLITVGVYRILRSTGLVKLP